MNNKFFIQSLRHLVLILPIYKIQVHNEEVSLFVKRKNILQVLSFLKNNINCQFKVLTCISGVDFPSKKFRFQIVYELLSVRYNTRIRVKVLANELTPVQSSSYIYNGADWYESEIWDMYGVFFSNHKNLTRLLTDYGFEGYPLRKDFPLSGFVEASYDYTRKRVTNEKVELSQEYRAFKFTSPWETLKI